MSQRSQLMHQFRYEHMPYGRYVLVDGSYVYYNRKYAPIWSWKPGSLPAPVFGRPWIPHERQEWFYNDASFIDRKIAPFAVSLHILMDLMRGAGMEEHSAFVINSGPAQ